MKPAVPATAVVVVVPIALVALVALWSMQHPKDEQRLEQLCEEDRALLEETTNDAETMAPVGPVRVGGQWRVNCPQVDGGTVAHLLTPMDGGTAGKFVQTDTVYVAPIVGSSVKVRAGFGTGLTPSKGFELGVSGTSARDGVGVTLDASESSDPTCVSAGNAQQVDVIAGRQ